MHVNIHAVSTSHPWTVWAPFISHGGHPEWQICVSKPNTILPKNTKQTHPASPKTSHISGSSAKKTSGGLERSELGLEVRWLDGSIGWLDGWISIGSTYIYLYLSDLSILVYLQSYELDYLDLDALPCWEIPLFFKQLLWQIFISFGNLMGLDKPGSRHVTTAKPGTFPSTWWSYPKPTQTFWPGHCRSETVVTWPHFWSAMFPGALRFWRNGEIINWWVKRWAMAKHWTAHAAEMT